MYKDGQHNLKYLDCGPTGPKYGPLGPVSLTFGPLGPKMGPMGQIVDQFWKHPIKSNNTAMKPTSSQKMYSAKSRLRHCPNGQTRRTKLVPGGHIVIFVCFRLCSQVQVVKIHCLGNANSPFRGLFVTACN